MKGLKMPQRNPTPRSDRLLSSLVCLCPLPDEEMGRNAKAEMMCPRFPEPLPLEHPIPSLKEALEKVSAPHHHAKLNPHLSPEVKSAGIYNLTTVILHTKCRCTRQKEIKDVVDEGGNKKEKKRENNTEPHSLSTSQRTRREQNQNADADVR